MSEVFWLMLTLSLDRRGSFVGDRFGDFTTLIVDCLLWVLLRYREIGLAEILIKYLQVVVSILPRLVDLLLAFLKKRNVFVGNAKAMASRIKAIIFRIPSKLVDPMMLCPIVPPYVWSRSIPASGLK